MLRQTFRVLILRAFSHLIFFVNDIKIKPISIMGTESIDPWSILVRRTLVQNLEDFRLNKIEDLQL